MIQTALNGMIAILLARFVLNDVPHAAGMLGNSTDFRLERTNVDGRMLDALETTWHRVESDMSYEMQSALGILKEVMGHYYEEPCVAAWGNGVLVGVAVYETSFNKDKGILVTHIKELASFSHEPGIGRALLGEVIKIGQEKGSDIISASHGPGSRGFYEGLGFVQNTYYPEEPTLLMLGFSGSSKK